MKVALVYDRVNKWGGAERVLLSMHDLWPDAPLFTAVYDPKAASWAHVFRVQPSFLQRMPFAKYHHEWYPWLTPMAFESFSFDGFDLVISVTSAEAKTIITKPGTLHICYCLTPTRYLWSGFDIYAKSSWALGAFTPMLRRWDMIASQRPDFYIAISQHVRSRIRKYYHRDVAAVIYPPVDTEKFTIYSSQFTEKQKEEYFLVVSRLVPYKRIDIIVEAFNRLGWRLVIIGDGTERKRLKHLANSNIRFVTNHLTDDELVGYYQQCRAFVFAGDEDFGIAAVEAAACGKPVIAFGDSGVGESIAEGHTGIVFHQQSVNALVGALHTFTAQTYDPGLCRQHAKLFDTIRFQIRFKSAVEKIYRAYKSKTDNL